MAGPNSRLWSGPAGFGRTVAGTAAIPGCLAGLYWQDRRMGP